MSEEGKKDEPIVERLAKIISQLLRVIVFLVGVILVLLIGNFTGFPDIFSSSKIASQRPVKNVPAETEEEQKMKKEIAGFWKAPDTLEIPKTAQGEMIRYGRHLIANTSHYLGPKGTVMQTTNGMNCQNCHYDAGTKPWGNNYGGVAATYPKYRARSGAMENIYKRVNDCLERSLNGKSLDTLSPEMQAMKSYIEWLGKDVPKGKKPKAAGIYELAFLDRSADPGKGKALYSQKCASCHQVNGGGLKNTDKISYQYPPLWGEDSYNIGAGLYRLSRFAGLIKYNMPHGASYENPQLTDEEAWDIAAFVNSQPRPSKNLRMDWPKISEKPTDHPFGPFADAFTEQQHKYGPYPAIALAKKGSK